MTTLLHELDALAWLAEHGAPTARDWACDRLAVLTPADATPAADRADWPAWLATAELQGRLGWLAKRAPSVSEAVQWARLFEAGRLPEDTSALADALRAVLGSGLHVRDVWLTWSLAQLGAAEPADLQRLSDRDDPGLRWVLAAAAVRITGDAAVARTLGRQLQSQESQLVNLLQGLGVPAGTLFSLATMPVDQVLDALSRRVGVTVTAPLGSGSRKRRVQRAVQHLLHDVEHPAAHVLHGAFAEGIPSAWQQWPVALAAWLRATAEREAGPLIRALEHGDPTARSAARAELRTEHTELLIAALADDDRHETAAVLSVGRPEVPAAAIVDAWRRDPTPSVWLQAAAEAVAHRDERLPELLRAGDPDGLHLARWAPTVEVLEALLSMEVPADRGGRADLASALAATGDAAALPLLAGLVQADGAEPYSEAMALAEALTKKQLPGSS